ncbi:MAG: hypothetical protein JWP27_1629 [Flaviaesturariibacter sp.]|nr:hypothetical protein [Flaviaesturariibacter sp.]
MKKLLSVSLLAIVLVAGAVFAFYSCSRKTMCETCNSRQPNATIPVTYRSGGTAVTFSNTNVWTFAKPSLQDNGDAITPSASALAFFKELKEPQAGNAPFMAILYIGKQISRDPAFTDADITAVSTLRVQGNLVQHTFYQKEAGRFVRNKDLSIRISILSDNAIEYIRNNIAFANSANTSVLYLTLGSPISFSSPNHTDFLMKAAQKYVDRKLNRTTGYAADMSDWYKLPDGGNCQDRFCSTSSPNSTCTRSLEPAYPASFYCLKNPGGGSGGGGGGGGACSRNEHRDAITAAEAMEADSLSYTYNDPLHYGTEEYLTKKRLGEKYVQFYYFLSEIYKEKTDLSQMLKTARVLYAFNDRLDALLHPEGHEEEIFLTADMHERILDLFQDYKKIYSDEYVLGVFSNMEADMEWADGKTVREVDEGLN